MRVHVQTFGCRANRYDSEAVLAAATSGGLELATDATDADVVVINSCAVTAEAERDARRAVRRVARNNPKARLVVMGCSAALPDSAAVLAALPSVTDVVAGGDIAGVSRALGVPVSAGTARQQSARAVLRIQDGCDEHCTFCATTLARGANRSRPADALVREATALAAHHPEIVITGTHIGSYGMDTASSLGALVQRLVRDVPAVRFRLSSIEATEVDDALIELMAGEPRRLAPHVHAPLQSGSDRILKRMGRHWYSAATYAAAVERIVRRVGSAFGLGADIIVGFPGEMDADFARTRALVESLPFTYLHVFAYSPRQGTAAPRLPDRVDGSMSRGRSAVLRSIGESKKSAYAARRVGAVADVVVTTGAPAREGVTEDYLTLRAEPLRARGERYDQVLTADAFVGSVAAS